MTGRAHFNSWAPPTGRRILVPVTMAFALALASPACGGGSGASAGTGVDAATSSDAPLGTNGGATGTDAPPAPSPDADTTGDAMMPDTGATPDAAADDASGPPPPGPDGSATETSAALVWQGLANPIYAHDAWSVKDVAVYFAPTGIIHFYFSAFFADEGMERCHVAETTTPDMRTFAPAVVVFDGKADGWIGMCSPDVQKIGAEYVMTFNAWGDASPKPKQLFYSTSSDLSTWGPAQPLAATLTAGHSYIDAALGNPGDGRLFLFYKDDASNKTRLGAAPGLDGPWHVVGTGFPALLMPSGNENGLIHENYELLQIDGRWRVLTSDYSPRGEYLYTMRGTGQAETDWLTWEAGVRQSVQRETFNTNEVDNADYLVDRRPVDGFFYLFYAGRTEAMTHLGRGNNKIAVSRSTDMKVWSVAGK